MGFDWQYTYTKLNEILGVLGHKDISVEYTTLFDVLDLITDDLKQLKIFEKERKDIQNKERVLTCAFCGQEYPPGTPASNHEALTKHVEECPKHPLGIKIRELEKENKELKSYLHKLDDFLADLPVDIEEILENYEDE